MCEVNPLEAADPAKPRAGDRQVVFSAENPACSGYFRVSKISASRPVVQK